MKKRFAGAGALSQLQPVATGRVPISFRPLQRKSEGRCEWTTQLATRGSKTKARTSVYFLTRFSLPDTRRAAGQVMSQCVCVSVYVSVSVLLLMCPFARACAYGLQIGKECTRDTARYRHRVHTC